MTTQQLIVPNQFPRWMEIAYQTLDSEYTNLTYAPTANHVYLSGTTLEQGVNFSISGTTITKPVTSSKSAFVVCLDAITGTYIWHSWIVGSGDQIPTSILVNSTETALLVAGSSTTTDNMTFTVGESLISKPVTTGFAGFVLNLSAIDGSCNWSSWIDGTGNEYIHDIQVGSDGSIYYVGDSTTTGTSIDIGGTTATKPTTTASSGFLVKLDSVGTFVFSQWFYGSDNTFCRNLKIDSASGDYIVCGDTITAGTSFTISGTTIIKPTTSFVSAFLFRLLATDGTYVWDNWIYNSLNTYGNFVFLLDGNIYLGGRSNETGTSFYVSGIDIEKPATTNYSGYIIRLTLAGTYSASAWIDGPNFDYITELVVSGSILYVIGSSSSTGPSIRINNQDVQKPFTQNSAGFILALNSRSFEYLYGLWIDGSANEYNRGAVIQNDKVYFTGISNSTETTLMEGDYAQTKPVTSAEYGYVSLYQLDINILLKDVQLEFSASRNIRMFNCIGRFGQTRRALPTPDAPIPISTMALWLDAADTSSFTLVGSSVAQWNDKSGNGRHAIQTTSSVQPTRTGGNTVSFNGSQYFDINLDWLAGVSHSSFIVIQNTDYTNIYGAAIGGSSSNSLHVGFSSSSQYRINYWGNDYYPPVTANYRVGQFNLINYDWINNTSKTARANRAIEGTQNQQGIISNMSGGGRILNVTGQGIMTCQIREIIFILDANITPANRIAIENYLFTKWNITPAV